MRRQQNIVECQQSSQNVVFQHLSREILEEVFAFFFVHVETRGADFAGLQRVDQRFRVDQPAASGVDDHHAPLHRRDAAGVDQMVGLAVERAMQRNNVRLRVYFIKRRVSHPGFGGKRVIRIGVEHQHGHPEPAENFRRQPSDPSAADDARRLARHIEPHQPADRKISIPRARVCLMRFPIERQNQRDGMFGDRMRRVFRYSDDIDAPVRRLEIDVIIARAS